MNSVIAELMGAVETHVLELYDPHLGVIEHHARPLIEVSDRILARLIAAWREEVWDHAVALVEATDPAAREKLVEDIEEGSLHRVHVILLETKLRQGCF